MAKKGSLNSPMESAIVKDTSDRGKAGDTMDRNPCPYFSEPHSMGPDTIRTVFTSGVDGKDYHGPLENVAAISSPMSPMKNKK